MARLLGGLGARVTAAGTVREAVEFLSSREPPDCLILDLMLPDGCGVDVLRHVRTTGLAVRVAVATGCADRRVLAEVEGLGPERLFHKPVDIRALWAWVRGD
jgi:two-component system response regulator PilR (NtrC family)